MKLKICGVRSVDEARQLRDADVDYVGLNFIPASSRFITLDVALAIMPELAGIKTVGLFAGRPTDEVNDYARQLKLDYVQLHGGEPPEYARQIEAPVIWAMLVMPDCTPDSLVEFIDAYPADFFVLDRPVQGQGSPVDLALAQQVVNARRGKIFLAGGLTADNLPAVLAQVQPFGIDIAGGVRDAGNNLDPGKVHDCLAVLHRR